ncbi:hypothetical protein [Microbacterium sp. SLBN-111]|uniref:hypothetical protein n=1 Tax=Microbacterium sp. SLBN-111 TaxID=3377733 RepID=UPI003C780C4D
MATRAPETPWPDCEVCTTVPAYRDSYGERVLDIGLTEAHLGERLDDGRMRVLRGDVPLHDMVALAESDLKFTIVLFTQCEACRTTWFYGLCIRGQPIFKPDEPGAEYQWHWDEVPPRASWAR